MTREELGKFGHFHDYYLELEAIVKTAGMRADVVDAIWRTGTQSINIEEAMQRARLKNPVYVSALYSQWLAGGHDPDNLLKHFNVVAAQAVSTNPTVDPQPQPGPIPDPSGSGLKLVFRKDDGKEVFSSLITPYGKFFCEYGLGKGGPHILRLEPDGRLVSELHDPGIESFMHILDFGDGQPVVFCEYDAKIYKRINGSWQKSYSLTDQTGLVLGVAAIPPMLYANIHFYGQHKAGIIQSENLGKSWQYRFTHQNVDMFNMAAGMVGSGIDIRIAGAKNGYPVAFDAHGVVRWAMTGINTSWWSICGDPARTLWNMGTWDVAYGEANPPGIIHLHDGGQTREVFRTNRPHIHSIKRHSSGKWYAIATWSWSAPDNKTSQLLVSDDGGPPWREVTTIPTPHIIGMSFGDGGVYLTGGRKDAYGKVYFYKF